MTAKQLKEPQCLDCHVGIYQVGHFCMLTDPIWEKTGLGYLDGMLCLDCIEKRIGRPLRYTDFRKCDSKGARSDTNHIRRKTWGAARMLPIGWKIHLALRHIRRIQDDIV
jgi:hypothetical protein